MKPEGGSVKSNEHHKGTCATNNVSKSVYNCLPWRSIVEQHNRTARRLRFQWQSSETLQYGRVFRDKTPRPYMRNNDCAEMKLAFNCSSIHICPEQPLTPLALSYIIYKISRMTHFKMTCKMFFIKCALPIVTSPIENIVWRFSLAKHRLLATVLVGFKQHLF